jgi:integrase
MAIRTVTRGNTTALVIDFWYRGLDGHRRRFVRQAHALDRDAAALEECALRSALAAHGTPRRPLAEPARASREPTFADAVEAFRTLKAHTLKPSTRFNYETLIEGELLPMFGPRALTSMGSASFLELDADAVRRGLSVSSRRNRVSITRSVLRCALQLGLLAELPERPRLPPTRSKVACVPTPAEFARVMEAANEHERVAFALAYYAGLRSGEIRGLRRCDVALETGELRVTRAICRGVAAPPKSGHARIVPIAAPLVAHVSRALERPARPQDPVCVTRDGEAWSENGLRSALVRAQRKAGVRGWSLHSLRHAFVSMLFERGASAPVVQMLAGHLHLSVTQRYAHTTTEQLEVAMSRMPSPRLAFDEGDPAELAS